MKNNNRQNKFVFVVCGGREHVETLHFSLQWLRHFSKNEIWVVTDSKRNEIAVEHTHIIDVATPENFDHHQASIYLKTSLYKILPSGNLYCYLDTDVVALNSDVDDIFNHKTGVVTFAPDHCNMPQFSPYAVNCGCLSRNNSDWEELNGKLEKYDLKELVTEPALLKKQAELKKKLELIKRQKLKLFPIGARYLLPVSVIKFDDDVYYNKKSRVWFDKTGRQIMLDISRSAIQQIEKNSAWKWNELKRRWISPEGNDIHQLQCNHLKKTIEQKFELKINRSKWQHWNGGVFLFDDNSRNFLHLWHLRTMRIFKDPEWKIRDQGTLIATVWQLGLQNSPLLSKKFNFIADPSNPRLMISDDGKYITDDSFETSYRPSFMHIFHHFGKKGWEIWDWVEATLTKNHHE